MPAPGHCAVVAWKGRIAQTRRLDAVCRSSPRRGLLTLLPGTPAAVDEAAIFCRSVSAMLIVPAVVPVAVKKSCVVTRPIHIPIYAAFYFARRVAPQGCRDVCRLRPWYPASSNPLRRPPLDDDVISVLGPVPPSYTSSNPPLVASGTPVSFETRWWVSSQVDLADSDKHGNPLRFPPSIEVSHHTRPARSFRKPASLVPQAHRLPVSPTLGQPGSCCGRGGQIWLASELVGR